MDLIRKLMMYMIGSFYALQVTLRLLWQFITNPSIIFNKKIRTNPPTCLLNSSKWKHKYARLKNVRLHYVEAGPEDKPLMIMLHGFPEFWYSWRFQIPEFSKDYRVVALDNRGYGDSDKPKGVKNYAMDHLTGDLKEMIENLGYTSAVVVGHDWGAAISWAFAMKYPEMVDQLIIMNVPHPAAFAKHLAKSKSQFKKSWYAFFFQLPCLAEFFLSYNDYEQIEACFTKEPWGAKKGAFTEEDIEAYKFNAASEGTLTCAVNYYRANIGRKRGSTKDKLKMPVCVIFGTNDGALDTEMAIMSEDYCEDFTLNLVEGISHWVQQEAPDECTKHMKNFLANKKGVTATTKF